MFISQKVLEGVLRRQGEERSYFATQCTAETCILGGIKSKSEKLAARKKVDLELLHHSLGNISTISLMAGDTEMFWKYIELRTDTDPFCTLCQIPSMNKKARPKNPIKTKSPFKWVFMDIITATAPKSLTSETMFSNYLFIVEAYSKTPKIYGIDKITTEEVMDKLDMFQSRFGKIDECGWWYLEIISADAGA